MNDNTRNIRNINKPHDAEGKEQPANPTPPAAKKETAPATTRRYIVTDKAGKERMGKSTSRGQAIEHVYKTEVRVATTDDVERLLEAGVKTEDWTATKSAD